MLPISPVIPGQDLPEVIIAKDQPEYMPLPVVFFQDGTILSRWHMNQAERTAVAVTGELFINLLLFGRKMPDVNFQIDKPFTDDAPEKEERKSYAGPDLVVLRNDQYEVWLALKLTDKDRQTLVANGDVYFFMETKGQPITPSMVQVEMPVLSGVQVEFCVALRKTDERIKSADLNGIETIECKCCVCDHDCFISIVSNETMVKKGAKILCTVCGEDAAGNPTVLADTLKEIQETIFNNTQD